MEVQESSAFTDDDKYFGTCGADGKFKVWDASSGILHQEFTPDSHLTSPCSCLAWIVTARNHTKRKKTPAKKIATDSGGTLNIAALGTASGAIHLYSLASANVESTLEGHTKKVNHLSWSRKTNLFSCGEDNLIIEWDVSTQNIVSKLKTGKESASCILVLPDGRSLISARNTLSWWDLETKEVIKTFTGHASPVVSLTYANGGTNKSDDYVLSGARDDIYICAWPLGVKKKSTVSAGVAATFVAVEPPKNVSTLCSDGVGATSLVVVTVGGYLQVFRHKLNGKSGKPLKPVLSVEISQSKGYHSPLHFANAKLLRDDQALVAYGNTPLLSFEQISTTSKETTLCLIRNAAQATSSAQTKSTAAVSKVKVPIEESAKYVHGPKRAFDGTGKSEMPMEHRLEVLALNAPAHDIFSAPTSSMMHQLLQGLNSHNEELLRSVLTRRDPEVIYNTVSMLPLRAINPLIRVLAKRIQGSYFPSKAASAWLRSILSVHAGQLLATGDLTDVFSEVMGIIETKLQVLPPLAQLRGRLDLLVEQVSVGQSGKQACPLPNDTYGPMINFVDNVTSDEGSDAEGVLDGSDDEQWDEESIMEGNNGIDGTSDSEEDQEEDDQDGEEEEDPDGQEEDDQDVEMVE